MANGLNRQPNKQGALMSKKGNISMVSIQGSCLKLLRVAIASRQFLSLSQSLLTQRGSCLYISILISSILGGLCLNSGEHVQFQEGYVLKFRILLLSSCLGDLCLHIQFPKDMCKIMMMILNGKCTRGVSKHAWGFT